VKIAPVADIKARLSSYLDECQDAPVIVTRNGRPAALLIPAPEDDEELERLILAHTPRFRRLIDEAAARVERGEGMSHEDFWKAAEKAGRPASVRKGKGTR
jgi:prevent-host-death family protein